MCKCIHIIILCGMYIILAALTIAAGPYSSAEISTSTPESGMITLHQFEKFDIFDWLLGVVGFGHVTDSTTTSSLSQQSSSSSVQCSKCNCGQAYKRRRIVGGVETQRNQYPWMAALMHESRFVCGGSLISNKYVLTAGHCVNGVIKERLYVILLDHDLSTPFDTRVLRIGVTAVIRHASYSLEGAYNNDIALLRLNTLLNITGLLQPVCLPPIGRSFTGEKGIVIGWGSKQLNGPTSTTLQEVDVPIWSNRDCRQKTGYSQQITDNMMCAGYKQGLRDSCQGDSGGPLHVINGTNHMIVGIVSWGEDCAKPNYPGVYTRVNRYITWIKGNTKDSCYCS